MAFASGLSPAIALEGGRKARGNLTRNRIRWIIAVMGAAFAIVAVRLIAFGAEVADTTIEGRERDSITASRPAILDRNGLELALDLRVPSLFAEPRRIIDVAEAVAAIRTVLPDLDRDWLTERLTGDRGFVWIARELTPAIKDQIMMLGIPGLDFVTESKRFYPGGREAAHVLGTVNIENQGIAGIEMRMDSAADIALLQELGLARDETLTPVSLSIDMRVQHIMQAQLADALTRYQAIAAAGVILDVRTGEILALASLPDFDPNAPATSTEPGTYNRITASNYELGSTFKTITLAGALDSGLVRITDRFDARFPIRFGRYSIDDFHGKHTILSVPEIYKYSSNIGTIRAMQQFGKDNFRAFLHRLHFDERIPLELPEMRVPDMPASFSDIAAATAAFGHGMSVSPLHMAAAIGALVNGGNYIAPTVYPRAPGEAADLYERVVSPQTSALVRYLMRLNALEGSGTRMNREADGYRAGGKTGTAEKVVNGRYSSEKSLAVFASAFPLDAPRYAMVILVDEPQPELATAGRTAGWNAGEVTGRIIRQAAPLLGVAPDFDAALDEALVPLALR